MGDKVLQMQRVLVNVAESVRELLLNDVADVLDRVNSLADVRANVGALCVRARERRD